MSLVPVCSDATLAFGRFSLAMVGTSLLSRIVARIAVMDKRVIP